MALCGELARTARNELWRLAEANRENAADEKFHFAVQREKVRYNAGGNGAGRGMKMPGEREGGWNAGGSEKFLRKAGKSS